MESSTNAKPIQSQDGERDEAPNDIRKEYDNNIENQEFKDAIINAAAGNVNNYNQDSGPHQEVGKATGTPRETSVRLHKATLTNVKFNACAGDVNNFEDGVPIRVNPSSGEGNKVKTLMTGGKIDGGIVNLCAGSVNTYGKKK